MTEEELEFKFNQVIYQPLFNHDESTKISEIVSRLDFQDTKVGNIKDSYSNPLEFDNNFKISQRDIRIAKAAVLPDNQDNNWIYQKIINLTQEKNEKFFNHHKLIFPPFEVMQYSVAGKLDWHLDMGGVHPYTKRIISIVVFLSDRDDYEGGELEFMPNLKKPIPMEQGSIILFPSHKIHRVASVTRGLRRTLVAWAYSEL